MRKWNELSKSRRIRTADNHNISTPLMITNWIVLFFSYASWLTRSEGLVLVILKTVSVMFRSSLAIGLYFECFHCRHSLSLNAVMNIHEVNDFAEPTQEYVSASYLFSLNSSHKFMIFTFSPPAEDFPIHQNSLS